MKGGKMNTEKVLPKYSSKWKCDECGEAHDDEDEARECCPPTVTEFWVCNGCEENFAEEKAAKAHGCKMFDPSRCLCGADLDENDEDASALLGSLVWCAACRELMIQGTPAPVARDRNFMERIGL